MKRNFLVLILLIFSAGLTVKFKPPTVKERVNAIGDTEKLPETLKRAFEPSGQFRPISAPKAGDWLAEHHEIGQTFDQFINSRPNKPDNIRKTIYLQPLGQFPDEPNNLVENLKEYAAAYFGMNVKVLAPVDLNNTAITSRKNPYTGKRQLLTADILDLLRKKLPSDAFCILGITMEDLYPDPSWNFVFGQASLRHRVGVYSFARYDPVFYGQERKKDYQEILLRRSCKVLVHETAHMFGLNHCIFYACVMNGSNHLQESDSRPLHLCPVCLRKLQWSIGFDVTQRYHNLYHFYKKVNFSKDAEWIYDRLEWIMGESETREFLKEKSPSDANK